MPSNVEPTKEELLKAVIFVSQKSGALTRDERSGHFYWIEPSGDVVHACVFCPEVR